MTRCPVCGSIVDVLFRHHDHFSDFCCRLLQRYDESQWKTFENEKICAACNAICPEVKRNVSTLPKFMSFSPAEMRRLLDGGLAQERATHPVQQFPPPYWRAYAAQIKSVVQVILPEKRKAYRPKLDALMALGVTREAIIAAWNDRTPSQNRSKDTRTEMLRLLEDAPMHFKTLCETPGHDDELAWLLYRELRWESQYANNFIYWYHVKHGDSYLRNNHLGLGPLAYKDWFVALSQGDVEKAQKIISKHEYWKRRRA